MFTWFVGPRIDQDLIKVRLFRMKTIVRTLALLPTVLRQGPLHRQVMVLRIRPGTRMAILQAIACSAAEDWDRQQQQ